MIVNCNKFNNIFLMGNRMLICGQNVSQMCTYHENMSSCHKKYVIINFMVLNTNT